MKENLKENISNINQTKLKKTQNSTNEDINNIEYLFNYDLSSLNSSKIISSLNVSESKDKIVTKEDFKINMENLSKLLKNNCISTPVFENDDFNTSNSNMQNYINITNNSEEQNITKIHFKTKEELKEERMKRISSLKKNITSDLSSLKTIEELKKLIGSNYNINSFQFQITSEEFKNVEQFNEKNKISDSQQKNFRNNKMNVLNKSKSKDLSIFKTKKRKGENETNKEIIYYKKKRHLIKKMIIKKNYNFQINIPKEIIFDLENEKEQYFGINNRYSLRNRIPKLIPYMGEKIEYINLKKDSGPTVKKVISRRLSHYFIKKI